jgi:hypothetical protein
VKIEKGACMATGVTHARSKRAMFAFTSTCYFTSHARFRSK